MEQEYPEDGKKFGCTVIYGILLALTGIVLATYVLLDGVPASMVAALGAEEMVPATVLLAGAAAVAVGVGLWYAQLWARGVVILLHGLGALLGLGIAFMPLVSGGRARYGLVTPATALMGVVVNVVIIAWFWRDREPEEEA